MIYREWNEFVTCPLDSERVRSRAERLDTRLREGVAVIPLSTILAEGDVFECMEVGDCGDVTIWTRDKVWFLAREGNGGKIENYVMCPEIRRQRKVRVDPLVQRMRDSRCCLQFGRQWSRIADWPQRETMANVGAP
jgi:hypothetical protein